MKGVWSFGTLASTDKRPGWGLGREGYAPPAESQIRPIPGPKSPPSTLGPGRYEEMHFGLAAKPPKSASRFLGWVPCVVHRPSAGRKGRSELGRRVF